jgi:hypothetical protein
MELGRQRMPKLPATPPPRPTTSLPQDRDEVNVRAFADEFDAIPLPDQMEAMARAPVCNEHNLKYIKSTLPISIHFEFEEFFQRMARNQWNAARRSPDAERKLPAGMHRGLNTPDTARPLFRGASPASGWKEIPGLKRVNAYVFRGDKRRVTDVRADGGFHPPSARTDDGYVQVISKRFAQYLKAQFGKDVDPADVAQYIRGQGPAGKVFVEYEIWRAVLDAEKFHIGRMVDSEFLRGYISTSRNPAVAKRFATSASEDGKRAPTYAVYAVHSEGGFLLPPRAQHIHGFKGDEAEIAHPGSIPWRKVMAFRTGMDMNLNDDRTFYKSSVIFVRKGFRQADLRGFGEVVAALGALPPM